MELFSSLHLLHTPAKVNLVLLHPQHIPGGKYSPILSLSNFTHPSRPQPSVTSSRQSSQMAPNNSINVNFYWALTVYKAQSKHLRHMNSLTPHIDPNRWVGNIPKIWRWRNKWRNNHFFPFNCHSVTESKDLQKQATLISLGKKKKCINEQR